MSGMTRDEWNAYCEAEAAGDSATVRAIFETLEKKADGGKNNDMDSSPGNRRSIDDCRRNSGSNSARQEE